MPWDPLLELQARAERPVFDRDVGMVVKNSSRLGLSRRDRYVLNGMPCSCLKSSLVARPEQRAGRPPKNDSLLPPGR